MKASLKLLFLSSATMLCLAESPKNEIALGIGGIPSISRGTAPSLDAGAGMAFEINYSRRVANLQAVAIYGEVEFLASPSRQISSVNTALTHDFASLYVTPGIRVSLLPGARISPFAVIGGGYGDYEQSTALINGKPNPAPRERSVGVFDFGGGVDFRVFRFLALRGSIRDFYTGSPDYNLSSISGSQHNVAATGSIVLRWK
jgi:hypothetical protein